MSRAKSAQEARKAVQAAALAALRASTTAGAAGQPDGPIRPLTGSDDGGPWVDYAGAWVAARAAGGWWLAGFGVVWANSVPRAQEKPNSRTRRRRRFTGLAPGFRVGKAGEKGFLPAVAAVARARPGWRAAAGNETGARAGLGRERIKGLEPRAESQNRMAEGLAGRDGRGV